MTRDFWSQNHINWTLSLKQRTLMLRIQSFDEQVAWNLIIPVVTELEMHSKLKVLRYALHLRLT